MTLPYGPDRLRCPACETEWVAPDSGDDTTDRGRQCPICGTAGRPATEPLRQS